MEVLFQVTLIFLLFLKLVVCDSSYCKFTIDGNDFDLSSIPPQSIDLSSCGPGEQYHIFTIDLCSNLEHSKCPSTKTRGPGNACDTYKAPGTSVAYWVGASKESSIKPGSTYDIGDTEFMQWTLMYEGNKETLTSPEWTRSVEITGYCDKTKKYEVACKSIDQYSAKTIYRFSVASKYACPSGPGWSTGILLAIFIPLGVVILISCVVTCIIIYVIMRVRARLSIAAARSRSRRRNTRGGGVYAPTNHYQRPPVRRAAAPILTSVTNAPTNDNNYSTVSSTFKKKMKIKPLGYQQPVYSEQDPVAQTMSFPRDDPYQSPFLTDTMTIDLSGETTRIPRGRVCPFCESLCIRSDACKHVQCGSCNYWFCHICLRTPPRKTDHCYYYGGESSNPDQLVMWECGAGYEHAYRKCPPRFSSNSSLFGKQTKRNKNMWFVGM